MNCDYKQTKIIKTILIIGLLVIGFFIFFRQINFSSADLGRHLKNGEILWTNAQVLYTNFYSYTEPMLSFVNHHWLSGVIFYGTFLLGGFKLLSVLNIFLALLVIIFAWRLATNKAEGYYAAILFVPALLLLSERPEIRPEMFSYLFIFLLWIIIESAPLFKKRFYWWAFPALFLLWANLHIYFIVGLVMLIGKTLIEIVMTAHLGFRVVWTTGRPWVVATIASVLAALFNPNIWRGLIYPLNIFANYGYEIAENKSVFYLEKMLINPNYLLFKILLVILVISWLLRLIFICQQKISQWGLFDLFLTLLFTVLSLFAVRNIAIFGLVAAVITTRNLVVIDKLVWPLGKLSLTNIYYLKVSLALTFVLAVIIFLASNSLVYLRFGNVSFGWGLRSQEEAAANFFISNNLQGPIFNNYDIGSSLIFWLYPTEKVFVDNRPEAYSQNFFSDIYKPMQNDSLAWREYSARYRIKSIYFSHTDSTPWAQSFIKNILQDPQWALVFFNDTTFILIDRKQYDVEMVKEIEISPEKFIIRFQALIDKNKSETVFNIASFAELAGYPELARAVYVNLLVNNKQNSRAWLALAYSYTNGERLERQRSLICFTQALATGWVLPETYNQMAMTYWGLGNYLAAETAWQSALTLDKNNINATYYINQVNELRSSGKLPSPAILFSY